MTEFKIITTIGTEEIGKLITTPKGVQVKEKISAGTIAKAIKNDNYSKGIQLLFDHDKKRVLGSTLDGVLELSETKQGFKIVCNLENNKEAYEAIKKKGNNGFSFGMKVLKDKIVNGVRSLDEIVLSEVSILLDLEPVYESKTEFRADEREFRNMNIIGGKLVEEIFENTDLNSYENKINEIIVEKAHKNSIIAKCKKEKCKHGACKFAVMKYEDIKRYNQNDCLTLEGSGFKEVEITPKPIYSVEKFSKGLNNQTIRRDSNFVITQLSNLVGLGVLDRLGSAINKDSLKVSMVAENEVDKIDKLLQTMKPNYLIGSIIVINQQIYKELIIAKNSSGKNLLKIEGDKLVYNEMLEVEVIDNIANTTIVNPNYIGKAENELTRIEEHLTTDNARLGILEYEMLYNADFLVLDKAGSIQIN